MTYFVKAYLRIKESNSVFVKLIKLIRKLYMRKTILKWHFQSINLANVGTDKILRGFKEEGFLSVSSHICKCCRPVETTHSLFRLSASSSLLTACSDDLIIFCFVKHTKYNYIACLLSIFLCFLLFTIEKLKKLFARWLIALYNFGKMLKFFSLHTESINFV